MSFIDPSRFATDRDMLKEFPGLPYMTLRVGHDGVRLFRCDGLHCERAHRMHSAFYRRVFGFKQLTTPGLIPD